VRRGILTIGDLLNYDLDNLYRIRNLGVKSINEIIAFIDSLKSETGELIYYTNDENDNDEINEIEKDSSSVTFRDANGLLCDDILLAIELKVQKRN